MINGGNEVTSSAYLLPLLLIFSGPVCLQANEILTFLGLQTNESGPENVGGAWT